MQTVSRRESDEEQSRALASAFDFAWKRLIRTDLIAPSQYAQTQNLLTGYLIKLARRGERNEGRLARRGIFYVCGIAVCDDGGYFPGSPLRPATGGAEIVF